MYVCETGSQVLVVDTAVFVDIHKVGKAVEISYGPSLLDFSFQEVGKFAHGDWVVESGTESLEQGMSCQRIVLNKIGKTRNDAFEGIVLFVSETTNPVHKLTIIDLMLDIPFDLPDEFSDIVHAEFASGDIADYLFKVSWGDLTQIIYILLLKKIKEFTSFILLVDFLI